MILESSHIDHTNLKPTATSNDIRKLCEEAKKYEFRAVCVHPCRVNLALSRLTNTNIKIVTVVGFPLGANTTEVKIFEAKRATDVGADEIDVVWNTGAFKNGVYVQVLEQLTRIVDAVKADHDCFVKVIVETCYLGSDELEKAYQIVLDSGADCIKTSTGFGSGGADRLAVAKWSKIRNGLKIKAAGGIYYYETAQRFVAIGADIIGTSHGVQIMKEKEEKHERKRSY